MRNISQNNHILEILICFNYNSALFVVMSYIIGSTLYLKTLLHIAKYIYNGGQCSIINSRILGPLFLKISLVVQGAGNIFIYFIFFLFHCAQGQILRKFVISINDGFLKSIFPFFLAKRTLILLELLSQSSQEDFLSQ